MDLTNDFPAVYKQLCLLQFLCLHSHKLQLEVTHHKEEISTLHKTLYNLS